VRSINMGFIGAGNGRTAYCKLLGWISASGKAATADGEQDPKNWPKGEYNSGRREGSGRGSYVPPPKGYNTGITDLVNWIPKPFKSKRGYEQRLIAVRLGRHRLGGRGKLLGSGWSLRASV